MDEIDDGGGVTRRGAWYVAMTLLAVVAVVVLALLVGGEEDGEPGASTATTTPTSATEAPSSSGTVTSTTGAPTTTAPPLDLSTAVWPGAGVAPITDPVAAATAFASAYLGFADPVVGEFQAGDSRSGEVEIRPVADGPVTTIMVRQLGSDGGWYVLGAATDTIVVDSPPVPATVSSPLTVTGEAVAFEGNVLVEVREDGAGESSDVLGEGFVTGGGDQMRPFEGSIEFSAPTTQYGALVLYTTSAEDGRVWAASVQRIELAPAT